jgi:hypothetical protein
MSKIDDGGPVAPNMVTQKFVDVNTVAKDTVKAEGGLSIRDYFAAAAMQGLCHGWEYCDLIDMSNKTLKPVAIPRAAYIIADAMLAARKEGA